MFKPKTNEGFSSKSVNEAKNVKNAAKSINKTVSKIQPPKQNEQQDFPK